MKTKLTNYRLGERISLLRFAIRDARNGHLSAKFAIKSLIPRIELELSKDPRFMGEDFTNRWPALKAQAEGAL